MYARICHAHTHTSTHTHTHTVPHLKNDLTMGVDVPVVAAYHAECHGVVGPLGHILHQLQSLLQVWSGHYSLLGGAMHVLCEWKEGKTINILSGCNPDRCKFCFSNETTVEPPNADTFGTILKCPDYLGVLFPTDLNP